MKKGKSDRPRDARGRFVKKEKAGDIRPVKTSPTVRIINRMAWGGGEPSLEEEIKRFRIRYFVCHYLIPALVALLLLIMLVACRSPQVIYKPYPVEVQRTKVVVERDTIYQVKLKEQEARVQQVAADSTSFLENDYAESTAALVGGQLYHSLTQKPGATVPVNVKEREIVIRDSIPYPVEVPGETVYMERSLSFLERILMWVGGIAITGTLVFLGYKGKRLVS